MARESPISHVLVARETVANITVPNSIAIARDDSGATEAADVLSSTIGNYMHAALCDVSPYGSSSDDSMSVDL